MEFDLLKLLGLEMPTYEDDKTEAPKPEIWGCKSDSHDKIVRTYTHAGYTVRGCGCHVDAGKDEEYARY